MEILAPAAEISGLINIATKTGDVGKFFFFRCHLAKATTSFFSTKYTNIQSTGRLNILNFSLILW